MDHRPKLRQRHYALALAVLGALFGFRVFAQLIQYFRPVKFLPDFNEWMSGAVFYPLLLLSQLAILVAMGVVSAVGCAARCDLP